MPEKVIVLGGGVAGMSAAHELVERGFDVEVYERQHIPGGKARSIPVFESLNDRGSEGVHGRALEKWRQLGGGKLPPHGKRPWLPGEHGFRFFPAFYKHIIDTMDRIPYGNGRVSDNLVNTSQVFLARSGGDGIVLPSRFPRTAGGVQSVLDFVRRLVSGDVGVPLNEVEFFLARIWQFITSCEERRQDEYEKIGWWDFVGAGERSKAYQKLFAHGFTRSLVASQAQLANTWTVGSMHLQLLFDIVDPTIPTSDRLLNGATNVVWIRPWLNYLESLGVKYSVDCTVQAINCSDDVVQGIVVEQDDARMEVKGDYYVAALPIERIAPLINPSLMAADPQLRHLPDLARNVAWMNGIQFYIMRPLPIAHGHVIYLDSPWALTSVSQGQFWTDFDLSNYADGDTRDILSVDISDWHTPGSSGFTASECTRDGIAEEVWKQLKDSLNVEGREVIRDEDLDYWFLDPDIRKDPLDRSGPFENVEPLLVNLKDTWRLRPEAVTAIPNLFLASDYVRTYTDLATMEAANEAARRAVNGIIAASGSSAPPCTLWPLHEPEVFQPLREYDRTRWQAGLPWDDHWVGVLLSMLEAVQKSTGLSSGDIGSLALPQISTDRAPSGREGNQNRTVGIQGLGQLSEQISSMINAELSGGVPPNDGQKQASPRLDALPRDNTGGPATLGPPRRRGRIRIVQK